ncbi:MAG TPA: hypothetical protein VFN67_40630, partial [Polyangiales bacterium]|nr:hypothetical protein [Polyangiales bacterium]
MAQTSPPNTGSGLPTDSLRLTTARFQVVKVLGSGGMATVYEVFDRSTQRHVALKRLHETSEPVRRRRVLNLFEREFYTLSQLSHPCVVEAYD